MAIHCSCQRTIASIATDYDVALVAIVKTIERLMHDLVCALVVVMGCVALMAVDVDASKNLRAIRFS